MSTAPVRPLSHLCEARVRVRGLRKRLGTIDAVDGIDLDVAAGETLGLVGPNGAGKTTLVRLLSGLFRADAGEIVIDGKVDPTRAAVRASLGVAPQDLALYGELTGVENLDFFGRLQGLSGEVLRVRVLRALSFAGLEERGGQRVRGYSGGMQRRLNLACATLHDPRVLFLDEPTAGVDPQSRRHLLAGIEALRREGTAIVFTTHHMEEAARVCDRIAVMDHGRIVALEGTARLAEEHGGGDLEAAFLALTGPRLRDA